MSEDHSIESADKLTISEDSYFDPWTLLIRVTGEDIHCVFEFANRDYEPICFMSWEDFTYLDEKVNTLLVANADHFGNLEAEAPWTPLTTLEEKTSLMEFLVGRFESEHSELTIAKEVDVNFQKILLEYLTGKVIFSSLALPYSGECSEQFLKQHVDSGRLQRLCPSGSWPDATLRLMKQIFQQKQFFEFDDRYLEGESPTLDKDFLTEMFSIWRAETDLLCWKTIPFVPDCTLLAMKTFWDGEVEEKKGTKVVRIRHPSIKAAAEICFVGQNKARLSFYRCTCGEEQGCPLKQHCRNIHKKWDVHKKNQISFFWLLRTVFRRTLNCV
uniref:BTB domain-containing protein n=1 Tax=Steinernema glaseri TaxID=37863 RepID=A0A1I8A2K3_9BILA